VIKRLFGLAVLSALWLVQTASAQDTDLSVPKAAPNQWFTGSLEAPSPALPKAGMLALEPYFIYQTDTGMYGNDGTHHAAHKICDHEQADSAGCSHKLPQLE
jgi:hypothetical protein